MYVLTHVLKLHLELLEKTGHENSDQSPCENEGDLELTDEEHDSYLVNVGFLQDGLVVDDVLSVLVQPLGCSIFVSLKVFLGLGGILV